MGIGNWGKDRVNCVAEAKQERRDQPIEGEEREGRKGHEEKHHKEKIHL